MTPKVTYVIPVSHPEYVMKAIDSALNQTVKEIEVLIADQGDVLPSIGYVTKYFKGHPDSRVRQIKRRGITSGQAVNEMIKEAQSDVIIFLCDDDWDESNKVEVILKGLKEHDIFRGSYNVVDAEGNKIDETIAPIYSFEDHMFNGLNINLACSGFNKSKCPLLNEKFTYLDDYAWWLECYKLGLRMGQTSEIVSNIRKWEGQLSSAPWEARLDDHKLFNEIYGISVNR